MSREFQHPPVPDPDSTTLLPTGRSESYYFESWDDGFRCWKVSDDIEGIRSVAFPYRIIDENDPVGINPDLEALFTISHGLSITESDPGHYSIGVDAEKLGRLDGEGIPEKLMPFQQLLKEIPLSQRVIASQCGKRHYLALEAMRHIPDFDTFLGQELDGAGFTYVLAIWALADAMNLPRQGRLALAERMMTLPRISMIESLTDLPCSKPFLRLLAKLPLADLKKEVVWKVFDLAAIPEMQLALASLPPFHADALRELARVPIWLTSPGLFAVLVEPFNAGKTLGSIIPPSLISAPKDSRERLADSLARAQSLEALESRISKWADKLYYDVAFPRPPFKGSNLLEPLRTALMLRREGRKMQHCVAGYAEDVLDGKSYFFAWRGKIRATVQLDRTREERWKLAEALGVENEPLPPEEMHGIVSALAEAFGDSGLFICRCHVAGTGYYDYDRAIHSFHDGMPVTLTRQPDNQHDERAIELLTEDGLKLGYVPRRYNEQAAEWLDAGLPVQGRMLSTDGWRLELFVVKNEHDLHVGL